MKQIKVQSPATVANVVCGFDCLAFALREPFDELTVSLNDSGRVTISHLDDFGLPVDPERNVTGAVLLSILRRIGGNTGFDVEIQKGIKPGSGIGSSAASAAGAAVAANELLGRPFGPYELVEVARDGELAACGSRIADNVSAAVFGGFTLVRTTEPVADVIALDFPDLWVTVIHPQIEIRTADARAVMKPDVPLPTAVLQWGNVGALVAGLARADYGLIARSLVDHVAEPFRKSLIPRFGEMKSAGLGAGALGGGISGAGPSVFMLSATERTARAVESAMAAAFAGSGIGFNLYVAPISRDGVRVIG